MRRRTKWEDAEVPDGYVVNRFGEVIQAVDEEIPDGASVHVPLYLKDSSQRRTAVVLDARNHQPHFATLTDAQCRRRNEAYDAYVQRTCSAWKDAGRVKPDPTEPAEDDDIDDRQRA